ncbi:MAG TPA: hypothetical protein PKY59_23650 [Pyrinomonadaceae bacterium]|nr:hypothetical protein [Pyrinomonadaceae bacterium]
MNDLERRITEMLWRVNNFGTVNNDAVKHNAKALAAFAAIQTAVAQLEAKGILRSSAGDAKLSNSAQRRFRRLEHNETLKSIAKTAREIAAENADFVNKFILSRTNKSDLDRIQTGRAFAVDLVPVKTFFTDLGQDEDFIEDLVEETDAFEATINDQDESNRDRIGANADIDDILNDALKSVRTLKIVVPNLFKGNPGKLADWTAASHVERPPKSKKQPKDNPPS